MVMLTRGTKDELLANIAGLEREAQQAAAQLKEAEERAEALANQLAETDGRAKLARRAVSDFEVRIAEQRQALVEAEEYDRACQTVEVAMRSRDEAALRVAAATTALLAHLDELATTRAAASSAHSAIVRRFGRSAHELPPLTAEPPEFAETWASLRERLRGEIEANLDEELLESAARGAWNAIDNLPAHLQAAARRRWKSHHG